MVFRFHEYVTPLPGVQHTNRIAHDLRLEVARIYIYYFKQNLIQLLLLL